MSLENHNNISPWKSKLDSLDSLPENNPYDKNEAWDKLYFRLGGKKRRKNKTWLWAAAACIFFTLMIPLFYSNRANQETNNSAFKKNQASIKTRSTIIDKDETVPITNVTVINNERKARSTRSKTVAGMIHENKKEKLRLSYTDSSKTMATETESNFMTLTDTVSSLTTIQPEKKKLRVVHINELGDPAETLPEVVRNSDKHTFQFKIANQEIYINPTTASNSNGFTILKIKSSQN